MRSLHGHVQLFSTISESKRQVSQKTSGKRNCSMHLYIELTVKYFISHVFTWCLKIIPFLSPYSHLDIVHRLIYLWSLKVSPYLLRLISPVLCVLCNPVWLNVHICFTSFHASFHSTSALLINIKVVSCSDFFISILSASFPLVCKFLCELFNAWEFVLALSISVLLFLLFFL